MPLVKLVVRTPRKLSETVSVLLFEAGAGGIEELDNGRRLVVYAGSKADADGIAERARELLRDALPEPSGIALSVEVDEKSDWDSAWTQHLRQIALTPKLVIQPIWDQASAPEGTRKILFDPKLAFGDGAHPTTRLAAVALQRACEVRPGARVLDFGSGSGVLAFVALFSGAAAAWGVDVDPVSIDAARQNARLNGFPERARFSLPSQLAEADFEVVVANLEAPTLLAVAGEIARFAARAAIVIVTGFLADREREVALAFAPEFRIERAAREGDWALLELVPQA
jgi:ribosomal protein L11 methyltransferase